MLSVLFNLFAFTGWVLGILGFMRAGKALAELRALRRTMAALQPMPVIVRQPPDGLEGVAPVVPEPAVAPVGPGPWEPSPTSDPEPGPPQSEDLESLITMRWGIWLGATALVFAGVFLVRYAVERGLLGPAARCTAAALLGVGLLAGAEWLKRRETPVAPGPFRFDEAPGGLAAGGTAVLFGACYGAGPFYGLLPPLVAFVLMAASSLVGLAAALRFGPLAAAVGIVAAFVTPALVATATPSLPGLFAYLFLVSVAALLTVRHTAWTWLGWATTIAGAIWICAGAIPNTPDRWAVAAFVAAAAGLHLALLPREALDHPIGRRLSWVPFLVLGAAGLLLESLTPGPAPRVVLFLLSPIAVWKGITEKRLDRLPWAAVLLGLLALLAWALPEWHPTGEPVTVGGVVRAVLPGDWAPEVIRPLLGTAALFAAFHAAAGLLWERRAAHPLHWAALVAAVPVLTLAVTYAQVARFQTDLAWAVLALALTAMLTGTTARAAAQGDPQRAGVHAAGAVAALALGCAMLLRDQWLTLSIALFLPGLAWLANRAALPALRQVALAVAALAMVRLLLNWYVLGYGFGTAFVFNNLLAAYLLPASAFAVASIQFRRGADDLLVEVLESGAVAFLAVFVALEIRHWGGDGGVGRPFSFGEAAVHLLTLAVQATAYLVLAQRTGRRILYWAAYGLGLAALAVGATLLLVNPAFTGASAGVPELIAAYLAPAAVAIYAIRHLPDPDARRLVAVYAVISGFAWISLQIRQVFHPDAMRLGSVGIEDAELWAWSGAWLAYGIALMALGIRLRGKLLRLAALGIIGLVCLKVFLVDMADLTGLLRVLSFLGLGLALIGLGVVHRRFVLPVNPRSAS
jgi:uncharacterized membrane protein